MQNLLTIPLSGRGKRSSTQPSTQNSPAVTYYAENSTWNIRLGRFTPAGSSKGTQKKDDFFLPVTILEWDWKGRRCLKKPWPRKEEKDTYRPSTLIDIRELLDSTVITEGRTYGVVEDGVIDEKDFSIRFFIISRTGKRGGRQLLSAEWCTWVPGPEKRLEVIIPEDELRRVLQESVSQKSISKNEDNDEHNK